MSPQNDQLPRTGRSSIVREIDQAMAEAYSAESFEDALDVVANQARLLIGAHQSAVSYIPGGNFKAAVHAISLSEKYEKYQSYDVMPTGEGVWAVVVEQKLRFCLTHEQLIAHPRWKNFSEMLDECGLEHPPMRGWLAVPVPSKSGSFVGLLQLTDKITGDFTEKDLELLDHLAALVAPTFELQHVHELLQHRQEELERQEQELERTNQRLAREQFLLNALVDNIPDPVFFKDRKGRFIRVNRAVAQVAGFDHPSEVIGKTDADLWASELSAATSVDEQRIMTTGQPIINKEEMLLREGIPERWVLVTKMPLRDDSSDIVGTFGVARDITERKRAEDELRETAEALASAKDALERSNMELQQFAYIASHDLQSPLRSISGFVQLLQQTYAGRLDEQADDWIARTVAGTKRMQTLIQDLLAYSRVDTKARPFTPVKLCEVFDSVVASLEASIHDTQAKVTRDDLPTVLGDQSQLVQLLQNLVGNGIKYHGPSLPCVHVSAERKGEEWVVAVRDNGIGIEAKHLETVFEIFRRLHTEKTYPGTGIGLAVCRRVVLRHGGRIWVESVPDRGSTFLFTIPEQEVRHD